MNKIQIENRKARYNYEIIKTLECGISLRGNEVKSIRNGSFQIKDSYIFIEDSQLILRGSYIPKWDTSNVFDVDERRDRVLLAHRKEINKLESQIKLKGYTLIPLRVYFNKNKCKVEIGLCKGKHTYNKRITEKERDIKRDIMRELKQN